MTRVWRFTLRFALFRYTFYIYECYIFTRIHGHQIGLVDTVYIECVCGINIFPFLLTLDDGRTQWFFNYFFFESKPSKWP